MITVLFMIGQVSMLMDRVICMGLSVSGSHRIGDFIHKDRNHL